MENDTLQPDLSEQQHSQFNVFTHEYSIATIFAVLPKKKQTLLFSATMPKMLTGQVADQVKQPVYSYEVIRSPLME